MLYNIVRENADEEEENIFYRPSFLFSLSDRNYGDVISWKTIWN